MKIICVTSGDPAGIGPDICLDIIKHSFNPAYRIVVIGDIEMLRERAKLLKQSVLIKAVALDELSSLPLSNCLYVLDVKCSVQVTPGKLNAANSHYVMQTLEQAASLCHDKLSNIIVTAPVNKEIINAAGIKFLGHTEYFAEQFNIPRVVMMLANDKMKVALVTTHMPLKEVAKHITRNNLNQTLKIIIDYFEKNYAIPNPKIAVCGLNPHAGDGGFLGTEELEIINPVIAQWQDKGYSVSGSYAADSIFLTAADYDLILAMYHDQGLPVLKYSGFESGINVTLGLPVIRTSVDHGTALEIAGKGLASSQSLMHAIQFAINCTHQKGL